MRNPWRPGLPLDWHVACDTLFSVTNRRAIVAATPMLALLGGCPGGQGAGQGDEDGSGISLPQETETEPGGQTEGPTDTDSGDENSSDGGLRFDVGFEEPQGCAGGSASDYAFSTIWIANSPQGTVSKIDTRTGSERGRYVTGPEADPDPSRTSVNLQGDVAVANRGGSVAKIATRLADCEDRDGDGTIATSSGSSDVLAWSDDECVLWHADLPFSGDDHTGGIIKVPSASRGKSMTATTASRLSGP